MADFGPCSGPGGVLGVALGRIADAMSDEDGKQDDAAGMAERGFDLRTTLQEAQ